MIKTFKSDKEIDALYAPKKIHWFPDIFGGKTVEVKLATKKQIKEDLFNFQKRSFPDTKWYSLFGEGLSSNSFFPEEVFEDLKDKLDKVLNDDIK